MKENSNHLKNLSIIAGHPVTRYEYIVSQDDLFKAYANAHKDLRYALRKEAKRDRFILNTEGMQKTINETMIDVFTEASDVLSDAVSTDIINKVQGAFNGSGAASSKSSFSADVGSMLGKAFGQSLVNLFDELLDPDD